MGMDELPCRSGMERRCESWLEVDPLAYVLHYWDEVGEMACGFIPNPNAQNAARRVGAIA